MHFLLPTLIALLASTASGSQSDAPTARPAAIPADAVALVDGAPIRAAEVDALIGPQILRLRQAEHDLRVQVIRGLAITKLIEAEAASREMTVEELREAEVHARVQPIGESELEAVAALFAQQSGKDAATARAHVRQTMTAERRNIRQREWEAGLLAAAELEILLDPPRTVLPDLAGDIVSGPGDAPVTLVAFTDYQCTRCASLHADLVGVRDRHAPRVRLVEKHYPLTIHEHAREMAEAALCARDQGFAAPMQAWLFSHGATYAREALLADAPALGLESTVLGGCLDSRAHGPEIEESFSLARSLGLASTPAVFVNGRGVADDVASVDALVREELQGMRRR